jgi:hypothetical protein
VLFVAVMSSAAATAHHSEAHYFDVTKAITLEGLILRVEWINPHALMFLQSNNEKGELETWTIQGAGGVVVARKPELRERLKSGTWVAARVFPPRNPLYLDDTQTVLLTRPDDPKTSSRIRGRGADQIVEWRRADLRRRADLLVSREIGLSRCPRYGK